MASAACSTSRLPRDISTSMLMPEQLSLRNDEYGAGFSSAYAESIRIARRWNVCVASAAQGVGRLEAASAPLMIVERARSAVASAKAFEKIAS